jgi:hypothetical protein
MRYIHVRWIHNFLDEPVDIYSELDPHNLEMRKVEIYRNGTVTFTDSVHSAGTTMLALVPFPPLEEISSQPEFDAHEISQSKFEILCSRFVTGQ